MTVLLETPTRTVEILMVEDDPSDAFFMQLALRRSRRPMRAETVADGVMALAHLRSQAGRATLPDLVMLDLSLPGKSGWEVLEEIKRDPNLEKVPVVVVSGSNNVKDVLRAREMESAFYLVKPMDMLEFSVLPKVIVQVLGQATWDPRVVDE